MVGKSLPVERLIVAADFDPRKFGGREGVKKKVIELAKSLKGLGVFIKVNSALRAVGYDLIDILHEWGLKVLADLKLIDIPNTMDFDGAFLEETKPEMVTLMCCAGIKGMYAAEQALGNHTHVLGVTVLTSLDDDECQGIFTTSSSATVLKFARYAQLAELGGLILSGKEVEIVKDKFELMLTLNTPAIRPKWSVVVGDDQSRIVTPAQSIINGADRIVVGRPIVGAKPNNKGFPQNSREAALRTLEEIREGLEILESSEDR